MKNLFSGILAIAAVSTFATMAQAGNGPIVVDLDATVNESVSNDGFFLQYSITNDGPIEPTQDSIAPINGFAVEFGLPPVEGEGVFTFETGAPADWTGSVQDAATFESENGLASDFFTLDDVVVFTSDTDSVGEGESLGGFSLSIFFEGDQLELQPFSSFVAFCQGQVCAQGETVVPEPGTLALFAAGVIGIGAAIRRRRRAA